MLARSSAQSIRVGLWSRSWPWASSSTPPSAAAAGQRGHGDGVRPAPGRVGVHPFDDVGLLAVEALGDQPGGVEPVLTREAHHLVDAGSAQLLVDVLRQGLAAAEHVGLVGRSLGAKTGSSEKVSSVSRRGLVPSASTA